MHDCLKLIHFHIGSQITNIRNVKTAIPRGGQYYVQLHKLGFPVEFRGRRRRVGVDYDGTRSATPSRRSTTLSKSTSNDIMYGLIEAADKNNLPHPNIITESGVRFSAHHTVLIIGGAGDGDLPEMPEEWVVGEGDHQFGERPVRDMGQPDATLGGWRVGTDAEQIRDEVVELFSHGLIDLRHPRTDRETLLVGNARDSLAR